MEIKLPIKWLDRIDSTQDELKRQIDRLDNLSVVAAKLQTAGRGQRGNAWHSAAGENLTFSLLLKPEQTDLGPVPAHEQFIVSEIACVAMLRLLDSVGCECLVKWPNDIYRRNKKLCGMLIENTLAADNVACSIIGIGLNVNQKTFPPELPNPSSILLCTGKPLSPERLLESYMEHFKSLLGLSRSSVREEYLSRLYRKDEWHEFSFGAAGERFKACIRGISDNGMLELEMRDGKVRGFAFKEVNYII